MPRSYHRYSSKTWWEVPNVAKPPVLKAKVVIPCKVKGPPHTETQKEELSALAQSTFNKRIFQDESDSSHRDRCWKKVKPSLMKHSDSNTHVEILASSSKTSPAIEKAWASIRTKLAGLTPNHASSIQDDVEVILNDMSGMGEDISSLQNLLGSFFRLATSYDQAQSTLVDETTTIKESESYWKAKEHLKLVLRERDEKFEEVFAICKSLEKARKK
ncbi:hypothetical protein CQW23_07090 [Capsicum baccatum]|uniref:Uncharacterized protein n=1 Tax=Capsicum baccatum TaxID=33114 RepID=A0A2G2X562_CAPBA|nr:hypothetical protein CQW23_07090 [Capsicum baccatum]